jgi:hypothetical protein
MLSQSDTRALETHTPVVMSKQGNAWRNDLGQSFPAAPLYRAACSCGWEGAAWYQSRDRAISHYDRHISEWLRADA